MGYIIPHSIVSLFLDEVASTGSWAGVCELGLACRTLESDAYRGYIGMGADSTGVLVDAVAPVKRMLP